MFSGLRVIVKCNVNRQGWEMADHVQPIGLVFITMREWFPCNLKAVRVPVNALSVVKSFYFYTKISRLIRVRIINGYSQYTVISENILHSISLI